MAGNSRWAQYAGLIDATEIAQILSADFNEGVDGRLAVPLGSVDPNASYLLGGSPSFRFTSHALDALLGRQNLREPHTKRAHRRTPWAGTDWRTCRS
jgi:hypothetical protein